MAFARRIPAGRVDDTSATAGSGGTPGLTRKASGGAMGDGSPTLTRKASTGALSGGSPPLLTRKQSMDPAQSKKQRDEAERQRKLKEGALKFKAIALGISVAELMDREKREAEAQAQAEAERQRRMVASEKERLLEDLGLDPELAKAGKLDSTTLVKSMSFRISSSKAVPQVAMVSPTAAGAGGAGHPTTTSTLSSPTSTVTGTVSSVGSPPASLIKPATTPRRFSMPEPSMLARAEAMEAEVAALAFKTAAANVVKLAPPILAEADTGADARGSTVEVPSTGEASAVQYAPMGSRSSTLASAGLSTLDGGRGGLKPVSPAAPTSAASPGHASPSPSPPGSRDGSSPLPTTAGSADRRRRPSLSQSPMPEATAAAIAAATAAATSTLAVTGKHAKLEETAVPPSALYLAGGGTLAPHVASPRRRSLDAGLAAVAADAAMESVVHVQSPLSPGAAAAGATMAGATARDWTAHPVVRTVPTPSPPPHGHPSTGPSPLSPIPSPANRSTTSAASSSVSGAVGGVVAGIISTTLAAARSAVAGSLGVGSGGGIVPTPPPSKPGSNVTSSSASSTPINPRVRRLSGLTNPADVPVGGSVGEAAGQPCLTVTNGTQASESTLSIDSVSYMAMSGVEGVNSSGGKGVAVGGAAVTSPSATLTASAHAAAASYAQTASAFMAKHPGLTASVVAGAAGHGDAVSTREIVKQWLAALELQPHAEALFRHGYDSLSRVLLLDQGTLAAAVPDMSQGHQRHLLVAVQMLKAAVGTVSGGDDARVWPSGSLVTGVGVPGGRASVGGKGGNEVRAAVAPA